MEQNIQNENDNNIQVFEVCWEVAKKMGGIYTVVKSKAAVASAFYRENYTIIAPFNSKCDLSEFEITKPKSEFLEKALYLFGVNHKIHWHFAKWLVQGSPNVILIDLDSSWNKLNEIRFEINPCLNDKDHEVNEALLFGYQVYCLFQELTNQKSASSGFQKTFFLAHFHEWLASVGLIYLRKFQLPVATVFTTHATLLGRWLSAGKIDFYHSIEHIQVDKEAGDRQIYSKHWLEKGAAHGAHIFSTVSEITAYEAKHLLGREVDILLPNGLQLDKFEALHEFQNLHAKYKAIIHEFVRGHFYGYYDFDLDNTLYFFTAGRYEVFNKGIDMFVEALSRLNYQLKKEQSPLTIVAFIVTNAGSKTKSFNAESLKGQSIIRETRKEINQIVEKMSEKIFEATTKGKLISSSELLDSEDFIRLKSRIAVLKQRSSYPSITTHNITDENDEILCLIRDHKLLNSPEDKVKIIYHPEFLSPLNPLLPLTYDQFVRGCHLGLFSSYYEPWGYTPSECLCLGVPSITSNLTGFANFMEQRINQKNLQNSGLFVVDRQFKHPEESMVQMTNFLYQFCKLNRRQRIELRNKTERLGQMLDWNSLHCHYENAHKLAVKKAFPEQRKEEDRGKKMNEKEMADMAREMSLTTLSDSSDFYVKTESQIHNQSNTNKEEAS